MNYKALSEEAAAGLSAGVVGTVLGYPFDVIKTRMQIYGSESRGMISTTISILRTQTLLSLYRGIAPPLISLSILNTITFPSYTYVQNGIGANRGFNAKNAIAGGMVGPLASSISTIENLVKTQMQIDSAGKRQYSNSMDCVRKIVHNNSATVLYTGHVVNTSRECVFLSTYFFMYEGLREGLLHGNLSDTSTAKTDRRWAIPVAGGMSGALAWTVSFPLDLVRARIQGVEIGVAKKHRQNAIHILVELIKQKGISGLFSGVSPSIIRAFLVSGSRFSAYEATLWLLRGGRDVGRFDF